MSYRARIDLTRLGNLAEKLRAYAAPNKTSAGRSWYSINNGPDTTEIYLYDMIGEWGVTAQDFVAELRKVTGPIDLYLNCEGGEVFDGLAIYAALARHSGPVTVHVDSLAASAASFVAQVGDRRIMARNARMMIHDARGLAYGTPAELREVADLFDDASDNIASIYADRAGGTPADWRAHMQAGVDGTWYTAQAAVDAGLADEVASVSARGSTALVGAGPSNSLPAPAPAPPADPAQPAAWEWNWRDVAQAVREAEEPPLTMPDVLPWQVQSDPNDPERRPA